VPCLASTARKKKIPFFFRACAVLLLVISP